jgi:DNA-binding SARP family transcriptional activator
MELDYGHQTLEIDNLRERAHRHVMRAQAHLGQRGCALRQYLACAQLLRDELGVEPSALTERLAAAIRAGSDLPAEAPLRR